MSEKKQMFRQLKRPSNLRAKNNLSYEKKKAESDNEEDDVKYVLKINNYHNNLFC